MKAHLELQQQLQPNIAQLKQVERKLTLSYSNSCTKHSTAKTGSTKAHLELQQQLQPNIAQRAQSISSLYRYCWFQLQKVFAISRGEIMLATCRLWVKCTRYFKGGKVTSGFSSKTKAKQNCIFNLKKVMWKYQLFIYLRGHLFAQGQNIKSYSYDW